MMRVLLTWTGLIPLMILNGIVREFLYGPSMPELRAHQVSTLTGILILGVYALLVVPWLRLESIGRAWKAGGIWGGLTVVFEFVFGHYVAGHPWPRLLNDYNLLEGRLWSLFLLVVLFAPPVAVAVRTGSLLGPSHED